MYLDFLFVGRFLSDHLLETQSLVSSNNLPSLQTKGQTYLYLHYDMYKMTSLSS